MELLVLITQLLDMVEDVAEMGCSNAHMEVAMEAVPEVVLDLTLMETMALPEVAEEIALILR